MFQVSAQETKTNSSVSSVTPNYFYVAPNGSPTGNGSINSPWDLKTAFNHPAAVQPGDVIYLRGGTYNVPSVELGFKSVLTGTANNPIKVMSHPGEWAVIDGNLSGSTFKNKTMISVYGAHTWYMNFEITNTETSNRKLTVSDSNPPERRGSSIYDYGTGTKLINLIIHDTGQGMGAWQQGSNNEYYGNIVYNNGWDAPDRLHGHGTYVQNDVGTKEFTDNMFFNQFGAISRTGGTDAASVRNLTWTGNVLFNGDMRWAGPNVENLKAFENMTYNMIFKVGMEVNSSYKSAEVRNNYLMGGVQFFEFAEGFIFKNNTVWNNTPAGKNLVIDSGTFWLPAKFTIDDNTYYKAYNSFPYWNFKVNYKGGKQRLLLSKRYSGYFAFDRTSGSQQTTFSYVRKSWRDDFRFDRNSTFIDTAPTGKKVFVRPNAYDPKRSNVIIYNWDLTNTVTVDVSSVLNPGDTYELRSVQDYFGDVTTGTYSGQPISVSMVGRTQAKPIGYDQVSSWYHDPLQPSTFPMFGAFVLIKTN
ncbi:MAG: hypothetical protein R2747_21110 [Pyrinomonadaceae bacterium]